MGDRLRSATGIKLKSIATPKLQSFANSGMAFESPPAPTSWMNSIRFGDSNAHWLITSWHLLSISAFSLWTEAKSSSSSLSPEDIDDAAPPPRPISMEGPPNTTTKSPTSIGFLRLFLFFTSPIPPANMIGLWYP